MVALVYGDVQGVGFRFFAQRAAGWLGVTGWVCNLPDGSVKIAAVGTPEQIENFRLKIKEGPAMSSVKELRYMIEDVDFNDYSGFDIQLGQGG